MLLKRKIFPSTFTSVLFFDLNKNCIRLEKNHKNINHLNNLIIFIYEANRVGKKIKIFSLHRSTKLLNFYISFYLIFVDDTRRRFSVYLKNVVSYTITRITPCFFFMTVYRMCVL
jgi:hypothetical protein